MVLAAVPLPLIIDFRISFSMLWSVPFFTSDLESSVTP